MVPLGVGLLLLLLVSTSYRASTFHLFDDGANAGAGDVEVDVDVTSSVVVIPLLGFSRKVEADAAEAEDEDSAAAAEEGREGGGMCCGCGCGWGVWGVVIDVGWCSAGQSASPSSAKIAASPRGAWLMYKWNLPPPSSIKSGGLPVA